MITFPTLVAGIPCQCKVTLDIPSTPAFIGSSVDSSRAPDMGGFEFEILDNKGYRAKWLEKKLTHSDNDRLEQEYLNQ